MNTLKRVLGDISKTLAILAFASVMVFFAWLIAMNPAYPQGASAPPAQADPASEAVAKQLGQLLIANAQCGAQVQALAQQNAEVAKKLSDSEEKLKGALALCGSKCAESGATPGEVEKKLKEGAQKDGNAK